MMLAGKIGFLLLVFVFAPAMIVSGFRGSSVKAGNVLFVAIGSVGFITLQWLL